MPCMDVCLCHACEAPCPRQSLGGAKSSPRSFQYRKAYDVIHLVMSIKKRKIVVNPEFTTIFPIFYQRRDRDSNPGCLKGTTVFETAPFDRSGISPLG